MKTETVHAMYYELNQPSHKAECCEAETPDAADVCNIYSGEEFGTHICQLEVGNMGLEFGGEAGRGI